jgi:hypothetical protein
MISAIRLFPIPLILSNPHPRASRRTRAGQRIGSSSAWAQLLPFLGARKAIQVTSADVTAYRVKRQEAGAAAATVNRELAALKRMFSLAVKGERLQRMPIEMLKENNARRGFFERDHFEAVRAHPPEYARTTSGGPQSPGQSEGGDRSRPLLTLCFNGGLDGT